MCADCPVELQVKRPLMPIQLSPEQVGLEMLCLCGQLDLLIRAQTQQFQDQLESGCSPEESDTFQLQGSDILDQMLQCLEHLPKPMPQLEDYLDLIGLSEMFPRVELVISSFRGIKVFSEIKKEIEANFKQLKQSLVAEEGSRHEPHLSAQYISWILEMTQNITLMVLSLPEEVTEELDPALTFMAQFLS
uniref:Uncharacterized protein n=1 Tax=Knipowitschia caucasica TaxID=637954 RepID=A0AAV2JXS1_KNICA